MPEITAYNISTFGKTYKAFEAMKAIADKPDANAQELLQQWSELQPLLGKLLLLAPAGSNEAPDFISQTYTGMPSAKELNLPECVTTTWERMRVLQGLFMHMQMWLFTAAALTAAEPHPFKATYYNDTLRNLINQLADLLECYDALPDSAQDWAIEVLDECLKEENSSS